ncbi:MAG TPA: nicotinate phosphoribosyltransferase [Pseudonocardia sp.]|nr:nicotinate phosphoribosyltransferase [Pseudonocardia sp.]
MAPGPTGTTGPGAATVTDLYEVTMALAYLREGLTAPATFSLFARELPPERGFLVAAGLADVVAYLSGFAVTDEDLATFAAALGRPVEDVAPLGGLRFTGDVRAVPEGRVVHAGEPLVEVTAPLPEAQLVETWVLNQVSHQTTLASKAARSVIAAAGRPVIDFSLRRTHGVEAGMHAARAGAIVGFAGTSNVAAAHAYGMAASGTMAHSFVQVFPTESAAFGAFARSMSGPGATGPVTLLVDTYDTEEGTRRAAEVLRTLPPDRAAGVRLDSGDLAELARRARRILDDAGLERARIVASGGLDEYALEELLTTGAPIDVLAVGTKVGTSADTPYLDAAYKLVEYDGRPVMKLSAGKATLPGAKQVFRGPGGAGVLGLRDEPPPPGTVPVLEPVVRAGEPCVPPLPAAVAVAEARRRFEADLAALPPSLRTIRRPGRLHPMLSPALRTLAEQVRHRLTATPGG